LEDINRNPSGRLSRHSFICHLTDVRITAFLPQGVLISRLDKKVAVITGAASGIGLATAIRFAGEGTAVVIGDLNLEGGEAAVRQCKENGGRAVFQKCNVQSESEIKALIDRAVSEYGKLDIIFNNAGIGGAVGTIEETTVEN